MLDWFSIMIDAASEAVLFADILAFKSVDLRTDGRTVSRSGRERQQVSR
jgi:hypothetical protein